MLVGGDGVGQLVDREVQLDGGTESGAEVVGDVEEVGEPSGLRPAVRALVEDDGNDEGEGVDGTGLVAEVAVPDADDVAEQPPGHQAIGGGLVSDTSTASPDALNGDR